MQVFRKLDGWAIAITLISALILAPFMALFLGLFNESPDWDHIASTVLPDYVWNTVIIVIGVGFLSALVAIPTAWFTASYEFPGRRVWEWALMMPLAVPTFTAAFVYYEVLNMSLPLMVWVRDHFGFAISQQFELGIRYGTLIVFLTAVLYPYLFACMHMTFSREQSLYFEVSRVLGHSSSSIFRKIALPLARPAIIGGLSLVTMEVINDYGAVNFFGVPTLTEGIFRSWFGLGDQVAGLRLASIVITLVFLVLSLEHWQRKRKRFSNLRQGSRPHERVRLSSEATIFVTFLCALPVVIGFVYPVIKLTQWAIFATASFEYLSFFKQIATSLLLAFGISGVVTLIAFFTAYSTRLHRGFLRRLIDSSTLGYAIPSVATGVGVMTLLGSIDNSSLAAMSSFMLSGTVIAIAYAYSVRFLTVAYMPILNGIEQTCHSLQEVSQSLGQSRWRSMTRIHLPLLKTHLLAGGTLVFIDLTKELPLTLILRPSGFETLATHAFGFAKEGQIYDCALPSLIIIALGIWGLRLIHQFRRN